MNVILLLKILLWVLVSSFIFGSWYYYVSKKIFALHDRVLATIIFSLSQIIVSEFAVGIIGFLNLVNLIGINIVFSAMVLYLALKTKKAKHQKEAKNNFKSWFIYVMLALTAIIIVRTLFYGIILHPYDYDGLEYHLPVIVDYIQKAKISDMDSNLFTRSHYPYTIELTYLWQMIFLKNDVFVNLSQFFYNIIATLSIYGISRYLRIDKKHSLLAAMLWFFIPIVIIQSTVIYIDLATSCLFLALVYTFLQFFSTQRKFWLLLFSTTAGIYLGTKYSAVFILIIFFFLLFASSLYKKQKFKAIFLNLLIFITVASLISGYWYIKNIILYHNPIYPHTITLFNKEFLSGFVPLNAIMDSQVPPEILNKSPWMQWIISWLLSPYGYIFDSRIGGFGPVWFIVGVPAIVISTIYSIIKKNYRFIAIASIFVLIFIIHPANWWSRYVIFITALGLISLAYLLMWCNKKISIFTSIVIIGASLFSLFTTMSDSYLATSPKNIYLLLKNRIYIPDESTDYITSEVHNLSNAKIGYGPGRFLYSAYGKNLDNKLYRIYDQDCNVFYQKVKDADIEYFIINHDIIGAYGGWAGNYIKELDQQTSCVKNSDDFNLIFRASEDSPYSLWKVKQQ